MSALSPFVYWAQNEKNIFLKVDLNDATNPVVDVQTSAISFHSLGKGAHGTQTYEFDLKFLETVNPEDKLVKVNGNSINITLAKSESGWWPRLISTPQKPSWLKIDFDKWQTEEELIEEKVDDVMNDYPDVYKNLMKRELGYEKQDFKQVYMLLYNLGMLSAFLYAWTVLTVTIIKHGLNDSTYLTVYSLLGKVLCVIHLFQALEIMHPVFGYVKGSPLMPFLQIFGRLFILFGNLEFEPRLQKMPVTTWLFIVWIYSDIIRYVYYIFHTSDSKNIIRHYVYPLTKWLRYSAWIVLYPIGFICESMIIFRNILYLHNEPRFYLRMPNSFNATFDYLTFMRIYMLLIMFPGMYSLMKHMYTARVKNLGGREPFDKIGFFKKQK